MTGNKSISTNNTNTHNESEDVEYYPRHKRAPYLYDIHDFGIAGPSSSSSRHPHDASADWDLLHDDGDGAGGSSLGLGIGIGGGGSGVGGSSSIPVKSASSSNLALRRRSSFARVFSTLGMSTAPIDEDGSGTTSGGVGGGGEGSLPYGAGDTTANNAADDGGGGSSVVSSRFEDSETNPNTLLPSSSSSSRFQLRRGSSQSVLAMEASRRGSIESIGGARDRLGSTGTSAGRTIDGTLMTSNYRIPRWALHDQSAMVMKDGHPVPVGTLLHHNNLLHRQLRRQQQQQQSYNNANSPPQYIVTPTWRLKERMKTVGVCLVLALNIGTDPPDLHKPTPCAKLQCWLDPTSISRAKAKERIGERLEQQYARWQQRSKLKYRRALDPTVETVKELCFRMREGARNERVLLHYNGHGVPRPTANGEIWLFDKHHTNYIPLSVTDLRRWIGKPSIVVLDCSGAGVLMPFFTARMDHGDGGAAAAGVGAGGGAAPMGAGAYHRSGSTNLSDDGPGTEYLRAIRDTIVLCPTSQGEWLPLNPDFPADIFTSCLTTPIPIALRWFVHQTPLSTQGLDLDTIADAIPGKLTDRKTPLGELNWIFTAITDTIAWNVLPSPLFQRLFRQDLLVASMFRNFLLADRILRSLNCSPQSHPELPSTCHHPLWQAWDLAVETCLTQLIDAGYLKKGAGNGNAAPAPKVEEEDVTSDNGPSSAAQPGQPQPPTHNITLSPQPPPAIVPEVHAPFFAEQLTAFEIWLEWASAKPRNKLVVRCPPSAVGGTPLPFLRGNGNADDDDEAALLQHELDPPEQLPIVLQVLLSQAHRVRALVLLRRFLDLGPSAVNLALSVGIFPYVLKLLQSPIDEYKHVLIGIWAKVVGFDPSCQEDVVKDRALPHFVRHLRWGLPPLSSPGPQQHPNPNAISSSSREDASEQRTMAAFILSVICSEYPLGQSECINEKLHTTCSVLLQTLESPEENERKEAERNLTPQFRMWLLICLGNLTKDNAMAQVELFSRGVHFRLLARLDDDAPDVRTASCYALGSLIGDAPAIMSSANDASPSLPSMLQQQLQPKLQQAPQALTPTSFQQGVGLLPGTLPGPLPGISTTMGMNLNLNNPTSAGLVPKGLTSASPLMPAFNQSITQQPGVTGLTSGLMTSNKAPMMFSNILAASSPSPPAVQASPEVTSVYNDEQRMDLDLSVAVKLAEATTDSSPVVRFEAILALNRFIGKYLEAFVSIAGTTFGGQLQTRSVLGGSMPSIPMPEGISEISGKKMEEVWAAVFKLHRSDPFPSIRELVNSIVIAVNKRAMAEKAKLRQLRTGSRRRSTAGLLEKGDEGDGLTVRRNATGLNLSSYGSQQQSSSPPQQLKRTSSAGTSSARNNMLALSPDSTNYQKGYNQSFPLYEAAPVEDYFYPESKLFGWKKVEFGEQGADNEALDPLSDKGAMKKYRKTRNIIMQQKSHLLKESFAVLAERPPMRMSQSPYAYDESDAAAGIEKEADLKKQALHLQQVALFRNSGARSTSLLRFHPYEPALVVCGSSDNVSVWNAQTSERMVAFSNGNPKNTRMTSALWVNEASTSLLLTGSSDGTVRIFDGLFESNDEISREKPSLISSFVAAPDIVTDKRYSSGLVLEFQQCGGRLIAGGNTKVIRCWDVATEKCRNTFESKSDASLTALTTAWEYDYNNGYSGLGPDIVVAGYGNGSLRIFDARSNNKGNPVLYLNEGLGRSGLLSRRRKYSEFDEHTSWIVDVSFTTYGGRHEIVSGCVAGSIKFWDLRYSSSVRTIDHKMQMTALAAHSNVPMFATGSPAQFIKIMSHDGMTQQVIRYHEKISGQRIGPVSCLSFHPHMPFLAAGFADEIVSLYAPKDAVI